VHKTLNLAVPKQTKQIHQNEKLKKNCIRPKQQIGTKKHADKQVMPSYISIKINGNKT
jgi:hypothetical protein